MSLHTLELIHNHNKTRHKRTTLYIENTERIITINVHLHHVFDITLDNDDNRKYHHQLQKKSRHLTYEFL